MKIDITKSGIRFGSMVKLFSVGYFIGMTILLVLVLAPVAYFGWGEPFPAIAWLIFPVLLVFQSLFSAMMVAAGIKLYGKVNKYEVCFKEEMNAKDSTTKGDSL